MHMISLDFYRLDKWFSGQEATGQLDLDAWQIVAAVRLATFLQGIVAVGQNQR